MVSVPSTLKLRPIVRTPVVPINFKSLNLQLLVPPDSKEAALTCASTVVVPPEPVTFVKSRPLVEPARVILPDTVRVCANDALPVGSIINFAPESRETPPEAVTVEARSPLVLENCNIPDAPPPTVNNP